MSNGFWVAIASAIGTLAILFWAWRGAAARAQQTAEENEVLVAEREELTARLAREAQTRKKQAEELAGFRNKADKVRRRQSKGNRDLPLGTAARVADLEEQLGRALRERDRSRDERDQLVARVAELDAALAVAKARAAPAPAAIESPTKSVSPTSPTTAPPSATSALVSAGQQEIDATLAESRERLAKLEEALELAKQNEARMRKRMNNQEQLYASLRAELEVKKDRLRTQEEQLQRLQAIRVVVSEQPPDSPPD